MRKQVVQQMAVGMSLAWSLAGGYAQQTVPATGAKVNAATPLAATAPTAVPALVPFSGSALDSKGKPLSGEMSATFLIYKDQQGGEPLFTESQMVSLDEAGRYKVQLGAASVSGLPSDLFATGEARWLEVQIAGQPAEPRILLASVPYALKAADAATLGGLPASAFALVGSNGVAAGTTPGTATPDAGTTVTTTGGTANKVAKFSGSNTIVNSSLYDNGTEVGIGTTSPTSTLTVAGTLTMNGPVLVNPTATATSSTAYDSQQLKFYASAYNSSSKAVNTPHFIWQAEPTGNNTSSPGTTLNLLAATANNGAAETGFYLNSNGTIHFAAGQTFPATSSTGTAITGTSSSGNGISGTSNTGDGVLGNTGGSTTNTAGVLGTAGTRSDFGIYNSAGVWGDSSTGIGVAGTSSRYIGVEGLSTSGTGMQGASTSGSGIIGSSSSGTGISGSSTSGSGMYGYTLGNTLGTAGTFGIAGSRTSFNGIAGIWGDAAAHVGVFGSSNQYSGVFGASQNGPGVMGVSSTSYGGEFSTSGELTAAVSATSSGSTNSALDASTSSTDGTAIFAVAQSAGGQGIYAEALGGTDSNGTAAIGVFSESTGRGVWGFSTEDTGLFGTSISTSNTREGFVSSNNSYEYIAGVWADTSRPRINSTYSTIYSLGALVATADDNTAGLMENNSEYPTLQLYNNGSGGAGPNIAGVMQATGKDGTCGIGSRGDLSCTGQVKTLSTTGSARMVETYTMQSAENWMEDFGSGSLSGGATTVTLDPVFLETANTGTQYHVFLTPRGDSKGLYVTNLTANGFEVHESGGGQSSLAFDYRIVAKRRGFESQRLTDVTEAFKAELAHNHASAVPIGSAREKQAQPLVPAVHRPPVHNVAAATRPVH